MKKIFIGNENIYCAEFEDEFIIRSGIWNYMEISFERKEFEENRSDYDAFIKLLKDTFRDGADEKEFFADPYRKNIAEQLLEFHLFESRDDEADKTKKSVQRIGYITDDDFIEEAKFIFDKGAIAASFLEGLLDDVLLSKIDYIKYSQTIENLRQKLPYDRFVIVMSKPKINMLKKLNRYLVETGLPSTLALNDGNFIIFTAFHPDYTGCFECLEKSSEVRMQGMANYLRYLKEEKCYTALKPNRDNFLFMASFIKRIDQENYYGISTPLEGKIFSIYLPTFEINIERLLRTPLCTTCGHVSATKASDYNLTTRNAIDELIKIHKNKTGGK